MQKKKKKSVKISRGNIISICVVVGVIFLIGYFTLQSLTPVNSDTIVFSPASNIFLKAVKSEQGNYHYMHTKGGKNIPYSEGASPPISLSKGNLIQIHLINEEKNQAGNPSKHNLNIDEFNVHIKDLNYFQSESVTFLADKTGSFDYYCSIHPDMRGVITIS